MWAGLGSAVQGGNLPAEGGQLPGHGDRDHGAPLAALLVKPDPALVEPALGSPGGVDHPGVMAALPTGELVGHPRWIAVLPSGLHQQPARVLGAGPGAAALPALVAGGSLARDQA